MELKKVRAVWFSATLTTETIVRTLADSLSRQLGLELSLFDFTLPEARRQEICFSADELVIVGIPVYAGRVPNVLLPYLTEKLRAQDAPVIPVVVYGNRHYDDALAELRGILLSNGFAPIAGGAFIGEHSFSRILAAGRPDKEDLQQVCAFADAIVRKVNAPDFDLSIPVTVRGNEPIRPYYVPKDEEGKPVSILKVKPETHSDRCTGCGLCATICPMGSICGDDFSRLSGICIKCCACVKRCPQNAKYFADESYLYHQHELEKNFARRAEPEWFV